ncbi:DoxX family protein [Polyangium aurulentum]|uniref:DoxX family protein n=1 Tax=Polyangium aurulentum TaxID=2567896 RepID=UPI0010AE6FEC|nr:DoxX family membrane protein [Polyangium aurulentum]UQA55370.1 DoxX family protein [Polyangium aurulentum]
MSGAKDARPVETNAAPAESRVKIALRVLLAIAMVGVGITHFTSPEPFVAIVPRALPWPLALVYVSGVAEIAGGVGILVPPVRRAAGIGLIALYVAVFPANVNMALNDLPLGDAPAPAWALWARLPLQAVFIAWAYWVAVRRPGRVSSS